MAPEGRTALKMGAACGELAERMQAVLLYRKVNITKQ